MSMPITPFENMLTQFATQLIEHYPEQYNQAIYSQIQQDKENIESNIGRIAQAVAMSEFVAETLQKQPHFLHQCWQQTPVPSDCERYSERLSELLATTENEEQLYKLLRQFRNCEMAKLSFCQTLNLATVEEIFIRLSQLAEALIIAARDWLYRQACAEMGTPKDREGNIQQLYILGMGKLGGFELNFSSDIDLIFTYPANGETDGARRAVDNAKFFTRLGQRLINALDKYTPDGFVYRTDMRLRPFG
ncbi:MAG TPA: bifunctional glutamine synthetase adenylyltransferase/deadenyltransferase, partial [Pasteurellaceae bacterium]|nr:bifunctional glutamine synthetase adenylyltransferase/deadenyltransferase [Pasteurellaceae bacterium]